MVPAIIQDTTLMPIAKEWQNRKHDLAEWVWENLVNRTEVWGQYTGKPKSKFKALTMPRREKRGEDHLTKEHLIKHFGTLKRSHLLGLHSQNKEGNCRWVAIDLDLHDSSGFEATELAARNFSAAKAWWETLQMRGFDPLLFDSNGKGGYHIWVLFSEPTPIAEVYDFAQEVMSDWAARSLEFAPETFPKSGELTEKGNGNWLRLPGLHHTHNHFTQVWSGDDWLEDPWLEGNEAINQILRTIPGRLIQSRNTNAKPNDHPLEIDSR